MVVALASRVGADIDDLDAQRLVERWVRPGQPRWKLRLRLLDWWRGTRPVTRYSRERFVEVPLDVDVAELEPDMTAERVDLHRALAMLTPDERVCVLTVVNGETLASAGERCGYSESRACQVRQRGLAALKLALTG